MTVGDMISILKDLPPETHISANGLDPVEEITVSVNHCYNKDNPNGKTYVEIYFSEG